MTGIASTPLSTFDATQTARLPQISAAAKNKQQIAKAASEFEAVFLNDVMQKMFSGISTDGLFGGGNAESMFRSMLIEQYAKDLSARGGIGINSALQTQIIRMQEGQ